MYVTLIDWHSTGYVGNVRTIQSLIISGRVGRQAFKQRRV